MYFKLNGLSDQRANLRDSIIDDFLHNLVRRDSDVHVYRQAESSADARTGHLSCHRSRHAMALGLSMALDRVDAKVRR